MGQGRQNVLNGFAASTAFQALAGTLYREANWLVADQLGTPRMVVNKLGSLSSVKRHDYLPFGEELYAGLGGRTTTQGYTGDSVRKRFTSKERDNETGLDYFLTRYYLSTQGRFTSPDSWAGRTISPQSLNLYSYVRNNPLKFADPTGHFTQDPNQDPNRPHPNKPCTKEHPCVPDENDTIVINTDQKKDHPASPDPVQTGLNIIGALLDEGTPGSILSEALQRVTSQVCLA